MREILFKAKRWSDGKWVYGDLNNLQDSVIIHWYNNGCRVADEVDPSTVSQYTGLTDKNGKKIFDGDKITGLFLHGQSVVAVVGFEGGSFGAKWKRGDTQEFSPFTGVCNVKWEVIGSIHDGEGGQDGRNL